MALIEQMTIYTACPTAHSSEVSSLELVSVRQRKGIIHKRKQNWILVIFSVRFTEQVNLMFQVVNNASKTGVAKNGHL
jgi:hypothetical protein